MRKHSEDQTALSMNTKRKRMIKGRGGARKGAGRPTAKLDPENWTQVTCFLRKTTLAALREGAGSRYFGDFLQDHLDRFRLPTREEYKLSKEGVPWSEITRDLPAARAARAQRKAEAEAKRFAKLPPDEQKFLRAVRKRIAKVFKPKKTRDHAGKIVPSQPLADSAR